MLPDPCGQKAMTQTSRPSRQRHESGAVAIEMAIVSAVFVLIIVGIFEFAIMLFAQNSVQAAAGELAALGRAEAEPALVLEGWRAGGDAVPFAGQMQVSSECYADLVAFLESAPKVACASARVLYWQVGMDWEAMTPIMQFVLSEDVIRLAASGLSYR